MLLSRSPLRRMLPKYIFPEAASMKTDFTVHNLPYGVFSKKGVRTIGVALGDKIIDCAKLADAGALPATFKEQTLNGFMGAGKSQWDEARSVLKKLVAEEGSSNEALLKESLVEQKDATMHLPCEIGDYTDFYASREHATNLGKMFRPNEEPLKPNWLHIPVGYHGRASSVAVSGTNLHRPHGQRVPPDQFAKGPPYQPVFGPSVVLDYELEVGCFVGGPATELGDYLTVEQAEDRLFGIVLLNDMSARDIQKWEYEPLGPFLGKNFGELI